MVLLVESGGRAMRKTRFKADLHAFETGDKITITSGSAVPKIDLARLFDRPRNDAVLPVSVPGGAAAAAQPHSVKTISLSDGSKIIFAAAVSLDELESA